ncbi:hypothetical protein ASG21_06245 [Chryseobacterium sp. Leaf394]|nr:hypothetical protein ASG21_06245 [Chryseobacterium sp. Leaf394]
MKTFKLKKNDSTIFYINSHIHLYLLCARKAGKILKPINKQMNRKIIHQIKEWGILIFWISFIIAFLYLLITVKKFLLIH